MTEHSIAACAAATDSLLSPATQPAPGSPPAAGGTQSSTGMAHLPPSARPPRWWTVPVLTIQTAGWMIAFAVTGIWQWRKLAQQPEFPWEQFCEQFGINYTALEEGQ